LSGGRLRLARWALGGGNAIARRNGGHGGPPYFQNVLSSRRERRFFGAQCRDLREAAPPTKLLRRWGAESAASRAALSSTS
jgi:hypothetical protein